MATTEHLHNNPEVKARRAEGVRAYNERRKMGLEPRVNMPEERLKSAEQRYLYWKRVVENKKIREAAKIERERIAAEGTVAAAQQRAVVKHALETRINNMEGVLNSILAHLTANNGKV